MQEAAKGAAADRVLVIALWLRQDLHILIRNAHIMGKSLID